MHVHMHMSRCGACTYACRAVTCVRVGTGSSTCMCAGSGSRGHRLWCSGRAAGSPPRLSASVTLRTLSSRIAAIAATACPHRVGRWAGGRVRGWGGEVCAGGERWEVRLRHACRLASPPVVLAKRSRYGCGASSGQCTFWKARYRKKGAGARAAACAHGDTMHTRASRRAAHGHWRPCGPCGPCGPRTASSMICTARRAKR